MTVSSEERVRQSWKSAEAHKLLDVYYAAKKRVMAGGVTLKTPEEWAGSLLVVHGADALEKFSELRRLAPGLPSPKKIKWLLFNAINADLAAQHGEVTCHTCGRQGTPTLSWRCHLSGDDDKLTWACHLCAPTLEGESS